MSATVKEPRASVRLEIEGMTCASCATRIERRLNGLGGVEAAVNFATEQVSVAYDPRAHDVSELVVAVEAAGYHASLPDAGLLDPIIGAATMAFSSVFVFSNSLRPRRFTSARATTPRGTP